VRLAIGPLILCLVVVVAAGAVHGVRTDRWSPSPQLQHALGNLARVPPTVGDWGGEDLPYEPKDMEGAGIKGCVFRSYRNPHSREVVSVLIVCGRGGPISVHTPDVCYAGAGYRQLTDAKAKDVGVGGQRNAFWVARFGKPGVVPVQLEIYWAWSRDGRTWEAPENPRTALARSPALHKMYVVRQFAPGSREESADSCQEFLQRALGDFGAALSAE
jgi:hypothetical protein